LDVDAVDVDKFFEMALNLADVVDVMHDEGHVRPGGAGGWLDVDLGDIAAAAGEDLGGADEDAGGVADLEGEGVRH
jgi:hypothetical protein